MDRETAIKYWEERFGIPPAAFIPYEFYSSARTIYIARQSSHKDKTSRLNTDFQGLPFVRKVTKFLKPTTVAAQKFGHLAKRNVIDIDQATLLALCRDKEITLEKDIEATDSGYVILRLPEFNTSEGHNGHYLGVALFLEPSKLLCRFPKSMAQGLVASLQKAMQLL